MFSLPPAYELSRELKNKQMDKQTNETLIPGKSVQGVWGVI